MVEVVGLDPDHEVARGGESISAKHVMSQSSCHHVARHSVQDTLAKSYSGILCPPTKSYSLSK